MKRITSYLVGLNAFNAVSAIGGGLALVSGSVKQSSWITHTDFHSLYFPGIILFAIVGGSALLAALAVKFNMVGWQIISTLAGIIMIFWILGEIVSIRQFHFLQFIYLVTGIVVISLSIFAKPTIRSYNKNQIKTPK